jgi:hypothetical protein
MSNYAYLTWGPSPVTNGTSEDDLPGSVLDAKYSIPLFWYALFDEKSIVEVANGGYSYPALCKPTKAAILLSCERWSRIRGLFDEDFAAQFIAWVDFLETKAKAHVICKTRELYGLFRTRELFMEELTTCLAAFDHVPKPDAGPARLNQWWRKLLGQCFATIQEGVIVAQGDYSFWGHGWRPSGHSDD